MKIKHIDPMGGGRIAALGLRMVERDEVVDVPDDVAAILLIQTLNWEPADTAAEDLAATAIPEHLAELVVASAEAGIVSAEALAEQPEGDQAEEPEVPVDNEIPGEGEPA